MMISPFFNAATYVLLGASMLTACQKQMEEPANRTIGHHGTQLSVRVGSIWGGGYKVDVTPEEYVVVEHASCPEAKEARSIDNRPKGLCVARITREESDRFVAAMERFRRRAVPLESFSVKDWPPRPDGKPCRNKVTDSTWISLFWMGTEGARIATFYTGCDREEFDDFYKSVLAVTDPLPIQQIIAER